jgi:hypothetical protein
MDETMEIPLNIPKKIMTTTYSTNYFEKQKTIKDINFSNKLYQPIKRVKGKQKFNPFSNLSSVTSSPI